MKKNDDLVRMYISGVKSEEVGKIFGCSADSVLKQVRMAGYDVRSKGFGKNNSGVNNPMFGKKHSESAKCLQSERAKEGFANGRIHPLKGKSRVIDIEWRRKISSGQTEEQKDKARRRMILLWKDDVYRDKMKKVYKNTMLSGKLMPKKTKAEKIADKILSRAGFIYVGDGSFFIGSKNPDFIKEKRVVEIFSVFHDPTIFEVDWHRTEMGTIEYYKRFGYKCNVIWYPRNNNLIQFLSELEVFMEKEIKNETGVITCQ
jgi:hypothetical protein